MSRRPKTGLNLNRTEVKVLKFLLGMEIAHNKFYSTYASDSFLQKYCVKSRSQLTRVLRHLEDLGLLLSSHNKPFQGTAVLFWLPYTKLGLIKEILNQKGKWGPIFAYAYTKRSHNPMPTYIIASTFNVSKRTAQRWMQKLAEQGKVRPTWMRRFHKRRWKTTRAYELVKSKPLTHWIDENERPNKSG